MHKTKRTSVFACPFCLAEEEDSFNSGASEFTRKSEASAPWQGVRRHSRAQSQIAHNHSSEATKNPTIFVGFLWRRKRDSNPRGLSPKRFSRPPRYDRFDIPPHDITVECIAIISYFVNRIIEIVAPKSVVVFGDVARDVFDHFAGDNKSRDRRNERKRARRRATARIHVVRVRRGFLFHRFFG